jgi:hypothetical protein
MPLPTGALRIADLGYFSLDNLSDLTTQQVYWLSRIFSQCLVIDQHNQTWDLVDLLSTYCDDRLDIAVRLGAKKRLPCRLMAVRVTEKVVNERRRRIKADATRRGRTASKRRLKLAEWTILVTSIPETLLSLDEAFVLMRVRWQIELLFKLWKSHAKIDDWRTQKPWRILCELYAKLIAVIIQHWIILQGCWRFPNRSLTKAAATIRKHAIHLAVAFASGAVQRLIEALQIISRCLALGGRLNKRKTKPNTSQLLLEINLNSLS